jgi:hypothetical protein
MRVVLYDHTGYQVFWGCIIGLLISASYWRVIRFFQRRYKHLEGKFLCQRGLLKHDLKLPCFRITRKLIPPLLHDLKDFQGTWQGDAGVHTISEDHLSALLYQSSLHTGSLRASFGIRGNSDPSVRRLLNEIEADRVERRRKAPLLEVPVPRVHSRESSATSMSSAPQHEQRPPKEQRSRSPQDRGVSFDVSIRQEDSPASDSSIQIRRLSLEWVMHGVSSRWGDCRGSLHSVGLGQSIAGMGEAEDVDIYWTQWKPGETSVDTWRKQVKSVYSRSASDVGGVSLTGDSHHSPQSENDGFRRNDRA